MRSLSKWGNKLLIQKSFTFTAEGTRETIARKDKQRNPDSIDCLKPRSRASPSFYTNFFKEYFSYDMIYYESDKRRWKLSNCLGNR